MKIIDLRFSTSKINLLHSLIGNELRFIRHDTFLYSKGIYGIAELNISGKKYKVTNLIETLDYYGNIEDVAVFRFDEANEEQINSLTNSSMITTPINSPIKEIHIINENQQLYYKGVQTYNVYIVRGLIFILNDGREVSFEKPVWFSEEIYIQTGYNLYKEFSNNDAFLEDWEKDYSAKYSRDIISIK